MAFIYMSAILAVNAQNTNAWVKWTNHTTVTSPEAKPAIKTTAKPETKHAVKHKVNMAEKQK